VDLSDIKGLGPAKQDALRAAGIGSVEDLAGLDLRRNVEVQGVTQDALKGLKQRARKALAADGKPVPKAPYRKNGKAGKAPAPVSRARKDVVTDFRAKPHASAEPVESAKPEKRGFLRRLLTRQ
jgi:predicted RecB family nuclease